ncbi:hypothetical protein HQ571_02450 [Candidatus Kuenenbacteria bacterium]|nr:hypothetical protein [Candidatus Kuenenbacteria bacterium]
MNLERSFHFVANRDMVYFNSMKAELLQVGVGFGISEEQINATAREVMEELASSSFIQDLVLVIGTVPDSTMKIVIDSLVDFPIIATYNGDQSGFVIAATNYGTELVDETAYKVGDFLSADLMEEA